MKLRKWQLFVSFRQALTGAAAAQGRATPYNRLQYDRDSSVGGTFRRGKGSAVLRSARI